jgi:hypothetical protein
MLGVTAHMNSQRTFYFSGAMIALLFGAAIYLMFRPSSLLMFRWCESLGVSGQITTVRSCSLPFSSSVPGWLLFSAPFALWVFSYLLCIRGVWHGSTSQTRHLWFWAIPFASIAAECGQRFAVIPGTFDICDLVSIVAVTLFALLIP